MGEQAPSIEDIKMASIAERIHCGSEQDNAFASARRPYQLFGAALVVLSTAAIAVVPSLARLAYDGGSDTLTVIAGRCVATAAVCFLVTIILGRPLRIASRSLAFSLGLGLLYAAHLYGLLGAVAYLPVNMVVLIYFLHPLIIGILAICAGHERASALRLGALTGAIIGLGLAVGFSSEGLSGLGIALAFMAALLAAAVITGSSLAMRNSDSLAVTSYMMLSAALCLVALSLARCDLKLPVTAAGWLGFTGVAIAHTTGTLAFFGAIPLLGAVRAAMITNLEPVLGILFAMLILGERISPTQGVGIAIVIASIFAIEMARPTAR
jgi:drug/metabolite transporter (DMT)-like permease